MRDIQKSLEKFMEKRQKKVRICKKCSTEYFTDDENYCRVCKNNLSTRKWQEINTEQNKENKKRWALKNKQEEKLS